MSEKSKRKCPLFLSRDFTFWDGVVVVVVANGIKSRRRRNKFHEKKVSEGKRKVSYKVLFSLFKRKKSKAKAVKTVVFSN